VTEFNTIVARLKATPPILRGSLALSLLYILLVLGVFLVPLHFNWLLQSASRCYGPRPSGLVRLGVGFKKANQGQDTKQLTTFLWDITYPLLEFNLL
jgi:hypothetical protein